MSKKILFVRSGGGMPGLDIHVGITLALAKHGIRSTHCIGTSAGAIISALDAAGYSAPELEDIVSGLNDDDVRVKRLFWRFRPWIDYIFRPTKIERLLEDLLPETFDDLEKPCGVHTTRNRDGAAVTWGTAGMENGQWIDQGWQPPLRRAVLASMSIHGFFPEVRIGKEDYTDGGTTAHCPIPLDLSYFDHVYVCVATPPTEYLRKNFLITRLMTNIQWLMRGQVDMAIAHAAREPNVTVIWPEVPKNNGTMRFDHKLIELAFIDTLQMLAGVR